MELAIAPLKAAISYRARRSIPEPRGPALEIKYQLMTMEELGLYRLRFHENPPFDPPKTTFQF